MSEEREHSPGPWGWGSTESDTSCSHIRDRRGDLVADVKWTGRFGRTDSPESLEESRANARLIAAAPDLLEALEKVLGVINESDGVVGWHRNGDIAEWGEFSDIIDAGEAALAKARGEVWDED